MVLLAGNGKYNCPTLTSFVLQCEVTVICSLIDIKACLTLCFSFYMLHDLQFGKR